MFVIGIKSIISVGLPMSPCSLKIRPDVLLFHKSKFPAYFPMFPKTYFIANVTLFPERNSPCSPVPQKQIMTMFHWEALSLLTIYLKGPWPNGLYDGDG